MPRKARAERYQQHECIQCEALFDAVRDDAKTCSARCRVAFNRDKKAAARSNQARKATLSIVLKCAGCGNEYDVFKTHKCPVCGALDHVPRS